jgi:hypothetical protein
MDTMEFTEVWSGSREVLILNSESNGDVSTATRWDSFRVTDSGALSVVPETE